jgi:hypothetical protein
MIKIEEELARNYSTLKPRERDRLVQQFEIEQQRLSAYFDALEGVSDMRSGVLITMEYLTVLMDIEENLRPFLGRFSHTEFDFDEPAPPVVGRAGKGKAKAPVAVAVAAAEAPTAAEQVAADVATLAPRPPSHGGASAVDAAPAGWTLVVARSRLRMYGRFNVTPTGIVCIPNGNLFVVPRAHLGFDGNADLMRESADASWSMATWKSAAMSALCHWKRHARAGQTVEGYMQEARDFLARCRTTAGLEPTMVLSLADPSRSLLRYRMDGQFIHVTEGDAPKIVTFGYNAV